MYQGGKKVMSDQSCHLHMNNYSLILHRNPPSMAHVCVHVCMYV